MIGFSPPAHYGRFPRQPLEATDVTQARRVFDGYDTGVRYADEHVGRWLNALADAGVLDETAVMISSDHGETLGELGTYCDHHFADEHTSHLPMILHWPGLAGAESGRVASRLHYQLDVAATVRASTPSTSCSRREVPGTDGVACWSTPTGCGRPVAASGPTRGSELVPTLRDATAG